MEARLHLPARDRVQGPRQPVAEAVAHLAPVERFGAALAVGVRRQVLRRTPPGGSACRDSRPAPARDPRPGRRVPAAPGRDGAPPRGRGGRSGRWRRAGCAPPAAASGAVVDDERLRAGGLDAHPEAAQPVVPGDPGLVGGLEVSTVRLVRVSLTLAVRLPVVVLMMRRGLAGAGRPMQPRVNTSRPIPGRAGDTGGTGVRRGRLNSSISH